MDINISFLNGELLLKDVRRESSVPFIMVTSKAFEADKVISYSYGADETDINKSLFKQTLIFFMTPLVLAIVHTYFGLMFCTDILKSINLDKKMCNRCYRISDYNIYNKSLK